MKTKSQKTYAATLALGLVVAGSGIVLAADEETADSASEAVPPPPEVIERQAYGQTITEYRRGNEIFMMTVKPRYGPKQYWNDPDGDGQFQRSTSDDVSEDMNLPKWRLGGW
jgi:hypothetical protein